jgi:hypothetical protein
MKIKLVSPFPPSVEEGKIETHYGVDFVVTGEDRIADLPDEDAAAMIECGRVVVVEEVVESGKGKK